MQLAGRVRTAQALRLTRLAQATSRPLSARTAALWRGLLVRRFLGPGIVHGSCPFASMARNRSASGESPYLPLSRSL